MPLSVISVHAQGQVRGLSELIGMLAHRRAEVSSICASFDDRFLEGAKMQEDNYPHGPKVGGRFSTATGNSAVVEIDSSDAYWLDEANEPLPVLDRDVRYRLTTEDGQVATLIAHIASSESATWTTACSVPPSAA